MVVTTNGSCQIAFANAHFHTMTLVMEITEGRPSVCSRIIALNFICFLVRSSVTIRSIDYPTKDIDFSIKCSNLINAKSIQL